MWSRITSEPLDPAALLTRVQAPSNGAVVLFVGTVRDVADGRPVTGMTYEAYVDMAEPVLAEIAREAAELAHGPHVAVEHRIGALELGEASVVIAVASPHRAPAYEASRHVIEQIKLRLPIWKHEHYADGASAWVEGVTPEAEPST
jgi:molybdopterin synthase catalytic subunit